MTIEDEEQQGDVERPLDVGRIRRLAQPVPALLVGRRVPFTTGVVIREATLAPRDGDGVIVRVRFEGGEHPPGTFDFTIDDSWGFGTTQDAVDQLYIDLLEQLDTGGR